jgi:hypothetical protein
VEEQEMETMAALGGHPGLLKTVLIVLGLAAFATYNAVEMVLAFVAERARGLSREFGGDPPPHRVLLYVWTPGPSLWRYIRSQCGRPGAERLHAVLRLGELLLVVRVACLGLAIGMFALAAFV